MSFSTREGSQIHIKHWSLKCFSILNKTCNLFQSYPEPGLGDGGHVLAVHSPSAGIRLGLVNSCKTGSAASAPHFQTISAQLHMLTLRA